MNEKRLVKTSKYLSRHLRHQPERLGISLEPGGWVAVDRLLEACAARSFALTRRELEEVVARNDKRRFSFDASGERIRANQGHSIEVDYVGGRHGPPAVLEVAAARMAADGHTFYVSDNGVWLVEAVPPEFLSRH